MPLTTKNIARSTTAKKAVSKAVIITKSKAAATDSLFEKKIKQMNSLLGKAKLHTSS